MHSTRPLIQSLLISLCLGLGFLHFAPAASPSASVGLRQLLLVPFGLCPLLSGGMLLHDFLEKRRPGLARLVYKAGIALLVLLAVALLWM